MNIDEGSIKLCGDFAEDFFKNFDKYSKRIKPADLFFKSDFETLKQKNALDNYILKNYLKLDLTKTSDIQIKKNMDTFIRSFYKQFLLNPTKLIDSPLLKRPTIVNKLCPDQIIINRTNN